MKDLPLLRRKNAGKPNDDAAPPAPLPALAPSAVAALNRAAGRRPGEDALVIEERSVWQPHSWLIQRCWETLAEAGAGPQALAAARLGAARQPAAPLQAILHLAQHAAERPDLQALVAQALALETRSLFDGAPPAAEQCAARFVLAAGAASIVQTPAAAYAYLERLDQVQKGWDKVFAAPDDRALLAGTVARTGLHPLGLALIAHGLRRFGDSGADFVQRAAEKLDAESAATSAPARMLQHCVDALRHGVLATLHSHRVAAGVFARAGMVEEALNEITVIGNIQEARRGAGITARSGDQNLLRQVKRPRANPDVDFQFYALREAVRALPAGRVSAEQRALLAAQLAALGTQSDGWTAAGAASTLVELGALDEAAAVVDAIAPADPTRSEGAIALVRGLLAVGDMFRADQETDKALAWVRALGKKNPERALIWGLAEANVDYGRPDRALELLGEWRNEPGFMDRLRARFGPTFGDDDLRIQRLRLQALLELRGSTLAPPGEVSAVIEKLRLWAPRLLEGEALSEFYADGLLRPLLAAGRGQQAAALLPDVLDALAASTGDKHTARVREVAALLARQVRLHAAQAQGANGGGAELRALVTRFLLDLWQKDAERGIWQAIHGVEGSLPLVLALDGPDALAAIAEAAAESGDLWSPP
jgi:hypothetical protein